MDSGKLQDWLQIVGLFGVIGSLVFVGLQMKQEQAIALSNAYLTRTDTSVQHIGQMMSSAEYLSGITKWRVDGPESLTDKESWAIYLNSMAWLNVFENAHYQYINGFLSEAHWQRSRQALKSQMRNSPRQAHFEATKEAWRPDYVDAVESIISELEAEPVRQ